MNVGRALRYMTPNVITLSSMIFGLVSLYSSSHGNFSLAAWMVIYAVLTDRIDGLTARALKATSELGMQLDSFADMLNFGVSPAFLVLSYVGARVEYYQSGTGHYLLFAMCGAYMLCAVFRLARYNIISDNDIPTRIFFGFPTTLAGGTMAIWILVFLKYDPTYPAFGGNKLFGDSLHTPPSVWKYLPIAMVVYGYLMASSLPMPKVGMTRNKVGTSIVSFLLLIGYACGFTMHYPELIFWMPTGWAIIFLVWGQTTAEGRSLKPPPLFPKRDEDRVLERPQEDLPDLVMDESAPSGDGSPPAAKP